jgi:hypothetical protein
VLEHRRGEEVELDRPVVRPADLGIPDVVVAALDTCDND